LRCFARESWTLIFERARLQAAPFLLALVGGFSP
jgi:hypothetical protein